MEYTLPAFEKDVAPLTPQVFTQAQIERQRHQTDILVHRAQSEQRVEVWAQR